MSEPRPRYWLALALFVATFLSTTVQGALHRSGSVFPLTAGLSYSVPLMAILVCHELGHYFAALAHRVPASLPYFIPMPFGLLGTMGAVIMQSATADRRKLIDIGAAGPLAGMVVAVPVLFYGLTLSEVRPLVGVGWQEGNSLLYAVMKYAAKGEWLPAGGRDVMLHPTAWAGWAGLFVTMLNLLPIGQLDGGHVATAYFGNRYGRVARVLHMALLLLSVAVLVFVYATASRELGALAQVPEGLSPAMMASQAAMLWLVWFVLLWVIRRLSQGEYHPPVDDFPLPASRRKLFWVVCLTFLLVFMPVPLRISVGSADGNDGPPPAVGATSR